MAFLDRVTRRRLVLALLLAASLALLTVFFRESETGALHDSQRSVAALAVPVEGVVQRVAQPFRDAWSWTRDLVHAKSERDRYARENAALQRQLAALQQAAADDTDMALLSRFVHDPRFVRQIAADWDYVGAHVTVRSTSIYNSKVVIDAGSSDGVRKHDPVITGEGWLVGQVTDLTAHSATVTLINDGSAAEGAMIAGRAASGTVMPSSGDRNTLVLSDVPKAREVQDGDLVVTSGWHSPGAQFRSIYPAGLIIGKVTNVATTETAIEQQIQVTPYADLQSFHTVLVLDPKRPVP